jgi:hypothetical protein
MKLLENYNKSVADIYEYFGLDFSQYPYQIDDCTDYYWYGVSDCVHFYGSEESYIKDDDNDYYILDFYYNNKAVIGENYTAMLLHHDDGQVTLSIFDNLKQIEYINE